MTGDEETVNKLQAEAMANLQKALLKAERAKAKDPFRAERALIATGMAKARLRRKLSQTDLAAKTGIPQPDISRLENGKGNPNLRTLLAIAKVLDANLVLEYKD